MKKPLIQRLWLIAIVLLVLQGGAFFLLQRARSSEVRPLHHPLAELPMQIGQWQGSDQVLG